MSNTASVVNIPAAVQRQAQEAERIHSAVYNQAAETSAKDEAPAAEGMVVPEGSVESSVAPAASAAPAPTTPVEKEENWQEKYNVLKGKYNKEILPLQQRIRDLSSELDAARTVLSTMETVQAAAKPSEIPGFSTPGKAYITDEDKEEFGEDTVDFVLRAARGASEATISQLMEKIAKLEAQVGTVGQTVVRTEREKLYSALDARIENWRDVNQSPEFINWLAMADPYSGVVRHDLLTKAFEANDAARVLRFFEGFLAEHAAVSERSPAQEPAQPQVALETLVAPGKPREGAVRAQEGGKRVWTQTEIRKFYRDVQNKRFDGRDKERVRIEQDIVAAAREGRVTA